jgi:catechol 2,3-dioxygenase-like lactoylglutathione lyase family enzyme
VNRLVALLVFSSLLFTAPGVAKPPKRPRILGVAHIALYVSDLQKSRAFYEDFLGYAEAFDIKRADGSVRIAFVKINDDQFVELLTDPPKQDGQLDHIAFITDNAEGMRKYLASQGVAVPVKVGKGDDGNVEFSVADPDGHGVEFVQYEPHSLTRRDAGKHLPDTRISTRLFHVGVPAGHLAATEKFYDDILGFQEIWRGGSGKTLGWVNTRVPDGDTGALDGSDYLEVQLYAGPLDPTTLGTRNHLCFQTPDIGKTVDILNARPNRKDYPRTIEIKTGKNCKRQVNLFDPDGTRIELMEPALAGCTSVAISTLPPPQ